MSLKSLVACSLTLLLIGGGHVCLHAQEDSPEASQADSARELDRQANADGSRRQDRLLGMVPLLRLEKVREELAVDDEQSKSLETVTLEIREDFGEQILAFLQALRDSSPDERRERRREGNDQLQEIRGKVNDRIKGVLNENQFQRLQQIEVQRLVRTRGISALTGEDIAASLDLTNDQKQQLRAQATASGSDRTSLSLEEVRAKVTEVLTSEQIQKLDTLFGKAFDLPQELLEPRRRRLFGRGEAREREGRLFGRRQRPADEGEDSGSNGRLSE